MRFSTKIVIASVIMTTLYTIACFALAVYNIDHMTDISVPPELTALYFGFWTAEIVMLASLDKTKIKNKYMREDKEDERVSQKTSES